MNSPSMTKDTDSKQRRYDDAYMRMAVEWAQLSHCNRKQVGALIVKDRMIIADGFNGTPTGFPNACETDAGETLSPCRDCAKLIHQAGISRVVYQRAYKDTGGIKFLAAAGVQVDALEMGSDASEESKD